MNLLSLSILSIVTLSITTIISRLALGLLIVLLSFCIKAQAQTIYTWVDDQGIPHFSHHPDNLFETSPLKPDRLPYINTAIALPLHTSNKKAKTLNQNKSSKPKKTGKQPPGENCQRYRKQLEKIQTALRRGYKEPQGNRYREQRRKYAGLLSQHCR